MKNRHGFTLVELLVGMGIFSILIVVLSQVFGEIMALKLKSESVSALSSDSRYVITRLAYDVARSQSITVSNPSTLTLDVTGHTYTYSAQNNLLTISYDGGTPERLHTPSTKIANLVFTKLAGLGGKQSVLVDLSLESNIMEPGGIIDSRHLISTYATR